MIENLMNVLIVMIVISIILSIIGFITKILYGTDISIYVNIATVIFGVLAITIYIFTTSNEDVVENMKVLTNWFLYMILFVIIPMAVGEAVSRFFYNLANIGYD